MWFKRKKTGRRISGMLAFMLVFSSIPVSAVEDGFSSVEVNYGEELVDSFETGEEIFPEVPSDSGNTGVLPDEDITNAFFSSLPDETQDGDSLSVNMPADEGDRPDEEEAWNTISYTDESESFGADLAALDEANYTAADEASKWNVSVYIPDLSPEENIRARILNQTGDEADGYLFSSFQQRIPENILYSVYAVELTSGYIENQNGITMMIGGVDLVDYECIALFHFHENGETKEIPFSYDAAMSQVWFITDGMQGENTIYFGFAEKKEESVSNSSDPQSENTIVHDIDGFDSTDESWNPPFIEEYLLEETTETSVGILPGDQPDAFDLEEEEGAQAATDDLADSVLENQVEIPSYSETEAIMETESETETATQIEDETEITTTAELSSTRLRSPLRSPSADTTWQDDYRYSLDEINHHIDIEHYLGSAEIITVPAKAVINGIDYETHIVRSSAYTNGLFSFSSNLKEVYFEDNVIADTMFHMFDHCEVLEKVDFTGINSSSSTDMSSLFERCIKLKSVIFPDGFDSSSVEYMFDMFSGCIALEEIDLKNLDTQSATYMSSMFYNCRSLKVIDVSGFHTTNVKTMSNMFKQCNSLESLDLSAFSTQNVTNMNNMIDCPALKYLDMSGFDYSQLSNSNNGFLGYAKKLRELKTGNGFGTNACLQVSDRDDTLWSDYGTGQYINSGDINGNNGSMIPPGDYRICSYYAFLYENGDLVIQFSESSDSDKGAILASYSNIGEAETTRRPWYDNSVVNQIQRVVFADPFTPRSIYAWFSGCQNLQEITGMDNIDVSHINSPYLDKAFENCTSLQCLDFSSFDTRNIASIEALIDGDHRLSTLILGRYFEFHGGVSLPGSSWIHQESGQVLTREFLEQNYDGTTMAGTYTSNSAVAILYEDGDLVFQNGTAPDPAKGSVLGIYFGFESAHYNSETPPWYGEKDAISKITFQTDVYPRYAHNLFSNLGNLTAISGIEHLHTEQCKCMANMFSGCSKLEMLDLSSMDTENVTEMEFMFSGCTALKAVDLSSFSTQNVTNMSYMFHECPALENLDLSSFDVRKVTAMDRMFLSCKALSGINLSSFHTESLVEMAGMFYGCESLQELDLSGFQTSLVSDMFGLFSSCTSLKTLDISSFDTITGNTAMENMFSQNNALQTIKLGERFRFNGSSNASWLPGLYWTRLSTGDEYESSELARVYDGSTMAGTYTNSSIKALLYENGELVLQKDMIPDPEKGNILKVYLTIETARTSPWRTEANTIQKVTIKHPFCPRSLYQFFCNCKNLTEIESIENMDTSNCTDFSYLFSGCSSLTNLDLSGFIVSPDAAAYAMLGTPSLEKIKLGELFRFNNASLDGTWKNVDTETVISGESLAASYDGSTMAGTYVRNDSYAILYKNGTMVFQRGRLSDPDLGEVDTIYSGFENTAYSSYSSVPWYRKADSIKNVIFKDTISPKGTSYWFYNCSELSEIENLDTLNFSEFLSAYGTAGMFYNCKKLKELDLRSFTISSLTNMQSMFCRCENLEIIDLSNLCTNTVKNMGQAFDGCTSLKILDLSSLGCRDVTNMNYAFRGCQSLLMLSLNADFVFKSSHSLPPMDWIRLDTQEEYTSEELAGLYNGIHEAATATYSRCTDIRFDASGGSTSFARKVCIYGTGIGELPSAARKGYFFDGWYTKRIGGIKIDEESIVDQSTYYAHWIPISYTLILNANGADPEDVTVNLDYSEPYTLPKDGYYREGYKLEGWNTRRNGRGYSYAAGDTIQKLSSEDGAVITLYAEWKELGYSILFDSLGGSAIPGRDIQAGHALGTLYSPAKDGFTFLGWFTQAEGGIQATAYTVPTEDTTYYAHWAKNPTLTFISNGDTPDYVKTVNYNSPIGQLPTASKENYTFIGWFTQNEGGEQVTPSTRAIHDTSYYAHWGLMLNFDPMGGRITEEAASDGMIAADPTAFLVESMPTVQKDGYTLDGWYSDPLNGNRVDLGDSVDLTQGSTLYAHWVPAESVTLTYDPNGGSLPAGTVNPVEYYVGQEIFNLPVPTKYGCAFTGWFTDAEEGEPIAQGTVITEDLTLYAHWNNAPLVYLTFNANGGSSARYPYSYYGSNSYSVFSVRSGDTIQTLPGSNLSGYVLDGWFTEAEGGDKITEETPILYDGATGTTSSNPRMYYAHWKPVRESGSTSDISYTYSASWQNASNEQADNREGRLTFHPTYDTQQTAALNVSFELNSAVDTVLPEGSVKIRVPKKAFKNWDGEWTGGNNLSANLPEYPSRRNGMYFSYINEEGDFYVLVNNTELTGGAGVNVTISYTAMPRDVPGGGQTKDGTYAEGYDYYHNTLPITFSIDKDLNGTADAEEVKSLEIEMHTRVLSSQQKSHTATYYQWNNTWGKKPYDAEDYFYVQWKLYEYLNSYSSTQNCTYEWSEDTVHDGTVVYMTDTAVVTKHPVSLFEETGNQGVTLYNEALLTETWKSGYKETYRLPASVTVYNASYPHGEFNKERYSSLTINGGQEDLLDEQQNVSIPYWLCYNGGSNEAPSWNDPTKTYTASPRTIVIEDGLRGDLIYSSGIAKDKYAWNPETGNTALSDNDYFIRNLYLELDEYDATKTGDVWSQPVVHEGISDYESCEIWTRLRGDDDFYLFASVSGHTASLTLPENTVGFQVRHPSSFYSTRLYVRANMYLMPTARVRGLIQDDVSIGATSLIKNVARCRIYNQDGNVFFQATNRGPDSSSALKEVYELNVSRTSLQVTKLADSSSNVIFDVEKGTQDNRVTIKAYNYNNSYRNKKFESGIFYDLLPLGTTVDENTISGSWSGKDSRGRYASGTILKSWYDVSFVSSWQGSGRTMMVITVSMPDSPDIKANTLSFSYSLHNTYENVIENGTTVENDVAFANTSAGKVPYFDTSSSQNIITFPELYDTIDAQYDAVGYAKANVNYIPVDAFSWGYSKTVMTVANYEQDGETLPNNEYTYKLTYSQSEYAKSDRIVFYDILEGGTETNISEWEGTLKNVNVNSIADVLNHGSTTAKCAPVVYYSTRAKDSFTGSDWDVTNTEIWTSAKPTDSSSITAIAVDCSMDTEGNSFILNGKSAMTVYITMTAPGNAEYIGKKAYNQAVSFARKSSGGVLEGDATPEYSEASVALKDSDLALSKESSPVSGTQAAPATVEHEDDLNYILAVTNNDGVFTLHDVIFEDMIPEGLDVDWEGVKVYLDDPDYAIGIDLTPRAALTRNGRKAIFSIRELNPGETLRFLIPTVVTALEGTIENCAKITSVNGMEKNIASERTYHKIFDPTAADLTEDVTIEKKWISPKSAIAFDIRDSEGKTSKVSCIVITDNEGAIVETIQGANGAILSQKAYDVEKSYTATITFEDGSTKSAVINADPFEKPEIVIKVTTEDEEKSVVLGDDGGWTDTVTLNVGSHVFEEITTGDWSTSQEFDDAAKKAVFTNTITKEIPITVINTTSHSIVPQTGNPKDNSRAFALALFLASIAILAGYLVSEKKRNKRS